MVGLGQVDELEVKRKGARQAISLGQVERAYAAQGRSKRLRGFCRRIRSLLGFAAADGNLPQLFHLGKKRLAGLLAQNLAEQHAQRANVAPQGRLFDVARARFEFSQAKRPILRFPKQSHCL